jgi:hypothetical protein
MQGINASMHLYVRARPGSKNQDGFWDMQVMGSMNHSRRASLAFLLFIYQKNKMAQIKTSALTNSLFEEAFSAPGPDGETKKGRIVDKCAKIP